MTHDCILGLALLSFNENHRLPPTKRASDITQRTSSRSDSSMESDMNSVFGDDHCSFGEQKPSTAVVLLPDSPIQERSNCRYSLSQTNRGKEQQPANFDVPNEHFDYFTRRTSTNANTENHDHICHSNYSKQSSRDKEQRRTFERVHTVTGKIPLFELEKSSSKKNYSRSENLHRSSLSFRRFSRKKSAIHDESTLLEAQMHHLKKEHTIQQDYDFYFKEATVLTQYTHTGAAPKKKCCTSAMRGSPVAGALPDGTFMAGAPSAGKASHLRRKKETRSAKREHQMKEVHMQAKFFMESCKIVSTSERDVHV